MTIVSFYSRLWLGHPRNRPRLPAQGYIKMFNSKKPLGVAALTALLTALSAEAGDLRVHLLGIETTQGQVQVALFADEQTFESSQPTNRAKTPAHVNDVWVTFEDVAPGRYGISAFHDVNINEKLDTSFVGLPKEPYGFSQNARGKFGPPSFTAISFEVESEPQSVEINLR